MNILKGLSSTVNALEIFIITFVYLIVLFSIILVSNLLFENYKYIYTILKSLGYSDKHNYLSLFSIFVPVIFLGILFGIPLSIVLCLGFSSLSFSAFGVLLLGPY
jgi:ABC-type lipoprotein release transport system permease subunit